MAIGHWIMVFLLTCPPLFNLGVRYGLEPPGLSCTIDYWHPEVNTGFSVYITLLTIIAYVLPFTTMIVCMAKTSKALNAATNG